MEGNPTYMRNIFFSVFVAGGLATAGLAQTVDTAILGIVTDAGQAGVPGTTVVISQPAKGVSRTVSTSPGGLYELRYLVPGEYQVEVQANGFRTERRTGIQIQIGQQARIDFSLQVGTV